MKPINKKAYQKYFFYGDENPEEALEGILFFTWQYDLSDREIEKDEQRLIKKAKELYQQYYRFIELNGKSKIYNPYRVEDEKILEERIRRKIEILKNTDEIVTEEQIQQKIREATQNKSQERKDRIAHNIRQEMEKRRTKKLFVNKNGLNYSLIQRFRYAHIPEGSMTKEENYTKFPQYVPYEKEQWGKGAKGKMQITKPHDNLVLDIARHWTEDLYDLLTTLKDIEQEDPKGYIDLWLRTRLNRAKNNTIEGIQEEEIKRIEHACKRIRETRQQEQEKEEEIYL